jgi:hypothetical protein
MVCLDGPCEGMEYLINNSPDFIEVKEPRRLKRWIVIHESLYEKDRICSHTCLSEQEAEAVKNSKHRRYIETVEFEWIEKV